MHFTVRRNGGSVLLDDCIITKKLLSLFKPRLHQLMRAAKPYSMVSRNRMQNLHRLLYRVERDHVPGDVVETGVAQGGTAILLTSLVLEASLERQVWLYDAFESLNPDGPQFEVVCETLFNTFGFDPQRVHLVKGIFKTTLPKYPGRPIAFLHIDASGYEPVRCCLENLYPHVHPGGWVVLDNYGVDNECRKAVNELLATEDRNGSLRRFGHTQAYFQL
jgi:O-methyltransferase